MEKTDTKNIRQLLSDPDLTIQQLLDRQDFASDVRNISSQFTQILNYQNIKKVMDWLIKVGPENDKKSYKFPLVAADLMTMQTPNINQYIFCPQDNKPPLFEYLFKFTELPDDYTLVGYFCKVMIAIIKRQFNFQSKYNQVLCDYLFTQNYIHKLINHLYSTSTIELLIRIFTLKSKSKDYYQNKKQFVIKVLQMMDNNQLSNQITQNIYFFIQSILLNETNNPNPNPNNYKSNIHVPNNYQIKSLAYEQQVIQILFKSVGITDRIRKTKSRVVNLYLNKYGSHQFYSVHHNKIEGYLNKVIDYLTDKAGNKDKISLGQIFLLDNIQSLMNSPVLEFYQTIINSLKILLTLIINSNWNNIFYQQVERIILLILSKYTANKLITTIIDSLIIFEKDNKNIDGNANNNNYIQFIYKIGKDIVRIGNRNINYNPQNQQYISYLRDVQQILDNKQIYKIGNSYSNPQTLAFAYNKQISIKSHLQFLSTQTIIIYQDKSDQKKLITKISKKQDKKQQIISRVSDKDIVQQPEQQYFFVKPQPIILSNVQQSQEQSDIDFSRNILKKQRIQYQLSQLLNDL